MNKVDRVLTSVKVDRVKFEDFKVECVRDKFSLTDLVDLCMTEYLVSDEFKAKILSRHR